MRLWSLLSLALTVPCLPAWATAYTYATLTGPSSASGFIVASGINNSGQVVGYSFGGGGFQYDSTSGTYTPIVAPGASAPTIPEAINNLGQIVGYVSVPFSNQLFRRDPAAGSFSDITPSPSYSGPRASDINDAGQIVGTFGNGTLSPNPVLTSFVRAADGTVTILADPKAQDGFYAGSTLASGINNAGLVVGGYANRFSNSVIPSGFIFDPATGTYTDVRYANAAATTLADINNVGQAVGSFSDNTMTTSFLLDLASNTYTTLADPEGIRTVVTQVNDLGGIVGTYYDSTGASHAFLGIPEDTAAVAEPASLAVLGSGIVFGLMRRQRRRRSGVNVER